MLQYLALFFLIVLSAPLAKGAVEIGVGTSSVTSGRLVPALAGSYTSTDWALSTGSVGVQTGYYYQSAYTLSYFSTWKAGTIFNGDVVAGFGAGVMTIQRGFRESTSASLEESSDFALGPALKVTYYPASSIFVSVEGIYGIRDLAANVTLNFQDVILFSFGVSL